LDSDNNKKKRKLTANQESDAEDIKTTKETPEEEVGEWSKFS